MVTSAVLEQPPSIRSTSDVALLRRRLNLTQPKFARIMGISTRRLADLEKGADLSDALQRRLTEIRRLVDALSEVIKPDALGAWMDRPCEAFGGRRPIQVIEDGEIDLLWAMHYHLASGDPA